jgi:hypothetical protein
VSPEVQFRLNQSLTRAAGREPIEWLGSPDPARTFLSAAGGHWLSGVVFLALGCFGVFGVLTRGELTALRDPVDIVLSLLVIAAVLGSTWRGITNLLLPCRMAVRARRQLVAATMTRLIVATDDAGEITIRTIMMRGIASIRHGVNRSISLKLIEQIASYDSMVPDQLVLSGLPNAAALFAHLQRQLARENNGATKSAHHGAGVKSGVLQFPLGRATAVLPVSGPSDMVRQRRLLIAAQEASKGSLLWNGRQNTSRTVRHYLSPRFVFLTLAGLLAALTVIAMIVTILRSAEPGPSPEWLLVICCAIMLGGLVREIMRLVSGARTSDTTLFAASAQELIIARDNGTTTDTTTIPRNWILSVTHSVHARDNTGTLIVSYDGTKPRIAICGVAKSTELYDVLVAR